MTSPSLVLASGSPRRRQLLEQLGLKFDIHPPDVDESVQGEEPPKSYVQRLSREKARVIGGRFPGSVVLAADTTVVLDGNILGKPESKQQGIDMLQLLSGREHLVLTGVTVSHGQSSTTFCSETRVRFRKLSPVEMDSYWETGEPADKAGGYGLQGTGAVFVESLQGCYSNVIGLPLADTVQLLRRYGIVCLGEGSEAREQGGADVGETDSEVVQDNRDG